LLFTRGVTTPTLLNAPREICTLAFYPVDSVKSSHEIDILLLNYRSDKLCWWAYVRPTLEFHSMALFTRRYSTSLPAQRWGKFYPMSCARCHRSLCLCYHHIYLRFLVLYSRSDKNYNGFLYSFISSFVKKHFPLGSFS
jgi:hypothetical protein